MAASPAWQVRIATRIDKSANDSNQYRGIELKNGLKALLVSNPTVVKSAIAMGIQIGSMSEKVPGLAHLCEHMLFLGTARFTRDVHSDEFIQNHGGSLNGYTNHDRGVYYIDVASEYFEEVCEIVAEYFKKPVFNQYCIERELISLHSEFELDLKKDRRRLQRVDEATANPKHPFSAFRAGTKRTLDIPDIRKELRGFYDRFYSSNLLSACLVGKESLDELTEMAVKLFSKIENKKVSLPRYKVDPYSKKELQLQIKIIPVSNLREMVISFPFPDPNTHHKTNPSSYFEWLIGDCGPHGLNTFLRASGFVTCMQTHVEYITRGYGRFSIFLNLTTDGLYHTDRILTALFQYLLFLKNTGPQRWLFNELQHLGRLEFRYWEPHSALEEARRHALNIPRRDWEDMLYPSSTIEEYNEGLINEFLDYLIPEKMRVMLVSDEFRSEAKLTEPHYSIKYKVKKIKPRKILKFKNVKPNNFFKMPFSNPLIPKMEYFCPVPEEPEFSKYPELVSNNNRQRVWFKQDMKFKMPRCNIFFDIRTPLVNRNPMNRALAKMALRYFRHANMEFLDQAARAGIYISIVARDSGLVLEIGGYKERLQLVLAEVFKRLVSLRIDSEQLEILKEEYSRTRCPDYLTSGSNRCQVTSLTDMVFKEVYWTHQQIEKLQKKTTAGKCEEFLKLILSKHHVEAFIHGYMTSEEARVMGCTLRRILQSETLTFGQTEDSREFSLKKKSVYQMMVDNAENTTNIVSIYYQVGLREAGTIQDKMLNDLLCQVIREPFFSNIRTIEQLGYSVSAHKNSRRRVFGIDLEVRSSGNTMKIWRRIHYFMNVTLKAILENMTDEFFETQKKALFVREFGEPRTLLAESYIYRSEIFGRSYCFDRKEIELAQLNRLEKHQLVDFYKKYIAHDGCSLRQFVLRIEPIKMSDQEAEAPPVPSRLILNLNRFRRNHELM